MPKGQGTEPWKSELTEFVTIGVLDKNALISNLIRIPQFLSRA
jgi:hypothetical protein